VSLVAGRVAVGARFAAPLRIDGPAGARIVTETPEGWRISRASGQHASDLVEESRAEAIACATEFANAKGELFPPDPAPAPPGPSARAPALARAAAPAPRPVSEADAKLGILSYGRSGGRRQ
jgi:hypothetical protein